MAFPTQKPPDMAKEAMKRLARALARAAAIEDYRIRNSGAGGECDEGCDLRPVQLRQADR